MYNKNPNSYSRVHIIQKDSVKNNILTFISERLNAGCRDDFDKEYNLLKQRIDEVSLHEVHARYHDKCYRKFYIYRPTGVSGHQTSQLVSNAADFVINYLCAHSEEECQFSVCEILSEYKGESIETLKSLERSIKNYFGNEVNVIKVRKDIIVSFQEASNKILTDKWYELKKKDVTEERERVVKTAAKIICQDIKSKYYDVLSYPAPEFFLENAKSDIPASLLLLLRTIILTNKKSSTPLEIEKWMKRIMTVAHIIIFATRPRSFLSSILLGISTMLHKKHASKNLIDSLSHIGLCKSYSETVLFEASIVSEPQNYNTGDAYIQCIFDNADHNAATIDGRNTFHSMGGVICATPASNISCQRTIPRLRKLPSAETIGKFGFIPLKHFEKPKKSDLKNITFKNLDKENKISNIHDVFDCLWFWGKYTACAKIGGWNSFMEKVTPIEDFEISKIIPVPFVNSVPSDYNTIFTVLVEANARCVAQKQSNIAVTFDQPLYQKAIEIVNCCKGTSNFTKINKVFVRLGGFHLLMSYLGAIGDIMSGSGLKELFCELLAEASAIKALKGHAYARAIRAHVLIQAALAKVIFSYIDVSENDKKVLNDLLKKVNEQTDSNVLNCIQVQNLTKSFSLQMDSLKKNGPTAELWIQYFNMVQLAKKFIQAERSGNFIEHLNCIQEMLPYFHASGHNLYAKSAHLYVQDMLQLETHMDVIEFDKFSRKGYFTIRRKNKFRTGTWTDMIIEQVLMRSLKVSGGITHGRGQTDSVLCKWTLSSIVLIAVTEKIEEFCNVNYTTSHQHVDASSARINRDETDLGKLNNYLQDHNPFPTTEKILSISTGIVGNEAINSYKSLEIGNAAMQKIIGTSLDKVTFPRKHKVLSLSAVNSAIKIGDKVANVDPAAIFQRAALSVETKDDMKRFLKFELSTYPMSLFDDGGFRKTQKSLFYSNFDKMTDFTASQNDFFVIDGGFLLHKVRWNMKSSISEILNAYINFVKKKYTNGTIVFDGYSNICTKSTERLRRQNTNLGLEVRFDYNTVINQSQDKFLNIDNNKIRLIELLCKEFNKNNYSTKVAQDDADCLIVETGIMTSNSNPTSNTFIVGEDIDLLVIIHEKGRNLKNLFLLKPGRENEGDVIYSSSCFKIQELQGIIGFVHAMTGCDTTSALFQQGKNKLVKLLADRKDLQLLASEFYQPNASTLIIGQSGVQIIACLYGAKEKSDLGEIRFNHFKKAAFNTNVNLEKLPPTKGSAEQHSYRVYLQVQEWLGVKKDPTKWGWKIIDQSFTPIYSSDTMVPVELTNSIKCKCKKGCKTEACTCRKNGFKCTDMCGTCIEIKCTNINEITNEEESDTTDEQEISNEMPLAGFDENSDDENKMIYESNNTSEIEDESEHECLDSCSSSDDIEIKRRKLR